MPNPTTPRLGATLMVENQERAEVLFNEFALLVDVLMQGAVESSRLTAEPTGASEGQVWCIPGSATGTNWSGRSGQVAVWRSSAWTFLVPTEGWTFWDKAWNAYVRFDPDTSSWRRTVRVPQVDSSGGANPRPPSPIVGEMVFDNNPAIKRPIWWSGVQWIGADGSAV